MNKWLNLGGDQDTDRIRIAILVRHALAEVYMRPSASSFQAQAIQS